jgi:hypothetical protein
MNLNRLAEHDPTQRAWLAHTASHTDTRANCSDRDSPTDGGCSCSNQPYWVRNISSILLRCYGQGDREREIQMRPQNQGGIETGIHEFAPEVEHID